MQDATIAICPLCGRPLSGAPTTTTVDVAPYLLRRDPPISVRVHVACLSAPAAAVPAAGPVAAPGN